MREARPRSLLVEAKQDGPIPLDVSFACQPGELVALVGPSGSGKTTLLRTVAGLYAPGRGRVAVGEEVWFDASAGTNLRPHQRRAGFVFQNHALFPHMTALGNVVAALGHRPAGERVERARRILDRVHLVAVHERLPSQLSGGQQQRVAVARALAREPAVLLLDEPFSAVDRLTREGIYRELEELRTDLDIPALLVTHDLDEAARLGDRMVLIADGRLLQEGGPGEVLHRPKSLAAARLVGFRNLAPGTVVGHDEHREVTVVETWGRRLEASLRADLGPGEPVVWGVRSGAMRLDGSGSEQSLPCRIVAARDHGDETLVTLEPEGAPGERLVAQLPLGTKVGGDVVAVHLPPAALRLFKDEGRR
jgi:molybdate transport system ATP-binding protein